MDNYQEATRQAVRNDVERIAKRRNSGRAF